ncbi:unnamed protein product [Musa hybrid cultivar]
MSWRDHWAKQEGDLAFSKTRMKFNHLPILFFFVCNYCHCKSLYIEGVEGERIMIRWQPLEAFLC